ncbi:SDR family NAD(P)-dependent oxidoreductase [Arthrobacter sp. OV608]|uniref:SDR family NAD(P)-dependent oxidoreductase n=1 Tax=Arthrobacter sp. OV608 TaxID=1882768 RepID=UPI0008D2C75D|nr:SDR family NAD(P)-dependent oxidoreductase [Arthrobacter sp. OV608]SEQ94810.1 short chain dehydrogenase [Arthrobacter sp. OV608]
MKILSGQVAVITGGAGGIGFGLAEATAVRAARLFIADIREEALESVVDALWSSGAEVILVLTLERGDLFCNSAILIPLGPSHAYRGCGEGIDAEHGGRFRRDPHSLGGGGGI